ncbi:MAG: TIGR02147 family protein [Oligoflexales bacterium]|nr:TIGR02147 family protein [Oligoflexales bacterium]
MAKNLLAIIRPSGFMDYKTYFSCIYQYLKEHDNNYTYLQFAEDLGFSATNIMNHIIQGRRKLSIKAGEKIAEALFLPYEEKKYFFTLIRYCSAKNAKDQEEYFKELYNIRGRGLPSSIDQENMKYFSKWYYPVIGELARLDEFRSDPEWIIKKLFFSIRPKQAEEALEILEKIGILRFDRQLDRHFRTELDLSTPKEIAGMATTSYHIQMMELGMHAINKIPGRNRCINALTISVPEDAAEKIRQMMHNLQMEILAIEANHKNLPDQTIYQINIQLFPVSRNSKKKEEGDAS